MKILLIGPPGAGKGTIADLLSKKLNLPHIDFGSILRDHIKRKTVIGKKIEGPIKKGELIPSKLMDTIVKERLSQPDCKAGFIIDGYPRQLEEAEFLDGIEEIDHVIVLDVPEKVSIARLSARRVCVGCAVQIYGLPEKIGKACKACGGVLKQRDDDKPEAIKRRLEVYDDETAPLIEYYKPRDVLHVVDASGDVDSVLENVFSVLDVK